MTACAQAKKAAAVNEKKTAKYLEGFKKASAALKKYEGAAGAAPAGGAAGASGVPAADPLAAAAAAASAALAANLGGGA